MKIISVRFANLNSLPGPYLIRFDSTPLADTGLFAITGPTGAGKSTLLDAIAVGLYGRVPRHDRQVGEMVSRHADSAFSEVEFEVYATDADTGATTRVRYRSRWEVRRKTRGTDKGGLNQDAMTLVVSPSGEAVVSGKEAVPARVGELSGLDFGQFEQAILLSQGKFARFLHAPEKERSALLEKMTNVGIYSRLSVAAFEKAKEEELKTKLLRAKLDATRLLTEDERTALETQIALLNEQVEQHHEEYGELNVCLTWRTELDQLDRQLRDTTREVAQLQADDERLQPELARLAGHQRARDVATPLALAEAAAQELTRDVAQLRELEAALPDWEQAVRAANGRHATATETHAAAVAEETRLRPVLEEAGKQDAAIAVSQQQLTQKRQAHTQALQELAQEKAALARQAEEIAGLQTENTTLDQWLMAHSAEAELKTQLNELSREIIDLQGAQKELATRDARREELGKTQQATAADLLRQQRLAATALTEQQAIKDEGQPCRTERDALLAGTTSAALAQRADDLTTYLQGLQQLLPKAEATHDNHARAAALTAETEREAPALTTAETAVAHLETRRADGLRLLESYRRELRAQQALADLNAHRQQLQPHQPCPLCGALEHAFAHDFTAETTEQEQREAQQQQALTTLEQELRQATTDLTRRQTAQQQRQQLAREAAAAAEAARQQAEALAATLTPSPAQPADPAAIRELLADATAQHASTVAARRRLATLDERLAELRDKYTKAVEAVNVAQKEIPRLEERQLATETELSTIATEQVYWHEQAAIFQQTIQDMLRPHQLALPARLVFDGILATLRERAEHYDEQAGKLEKLGKELHERKGQHTVYEEKLAEKTSELAAAAAALEAEQEQVDQQRAARLAHYAGADPSAEAAQLHHTTRQLAEALTHAQTHLARQQQELAIRQNAKAERQTQLAAHQAAHAERQTELAAALAAAGLSTVAEAQALLLPPAEAEHLEKRRQDHRTAQAAATRRLADLTDEQHRHAEAALTPHSTAQLTAQLQALSAADDILQQKLGAIGNQLKQDDDARQQQAEGQRELQLRQQEEQRWQDLSEQIGSARGDKFVGSPGTELEFAL